MQLLPHTQETQPADAFRHNSTALRPARKPQMTMIWVTELVGNRTRLFARWTTQD